MMRSNWRWITLMTKFFFVSSSFSFDSQRMLSSIRFEVTKLYGDLARWCNIGAKVKWFQASADDCLIITFYGRWQVFTSVAHHLQLELLRKFAPINHRTRGKFQHESWAKKARNMNANKAASLLNETFKWNSSSRRKLNKQNLWLQRRLSLNLLHFHRQTIMFTFHRAFCYFLSLPFDWPTFLVIFSISVRDL
jgi:hypothetical protein